MAGKTIPYTDDKIRHLRCCRCGKKAVHQWKACADGGVWRPLCLQCDFDLNELALTFMRVPNAARKLRRYAKGLGLKP